MAENTSSGALPGCAAFTSMSAISRDGGVGSRHGAASA